MKTLPIILSLILLGSFSTIAQSDLTKEETIDAWTASKKSPATAEDFRNFTPDQKMNTRVDAIVNSLKQKSIDTIIVYTVSNPGYANMNSCFEFTYPIYSYILWGVNDTLHIKLIKGKCEYDKTRVDSPGIFSYYRNNGPIIDKEEIMPAIVSAQRTKENTVNYSTRSIDHEPKYTLHIQSDTTFKVFAFAETDIQNEQSLFHQYNLDLKSIQLLKLIRTETADCCSGRSR